MRLMGQLLGQGRAIAIGGHRGCGENLLSNPGRVEPAFRENTLASFKQAAALGVSFVEFDVQVTRDGVPVLWHDDEIIVQPPGQPTTIFEVKDRSISEFRALVESSGDYSKTNLVREFRDRDTRQRSPALVAWQCQKDDALPTLEQLFQVMPESVGFDIEVKMTVPDDVPATSQEEVDRVVLPIVETVTACAGASDRVIVYSSFDPDVCLKLASHQQKHEVMFLSGCGIYPHVDPRRTSVPAAISFAAQNNLAGIVLPASILMANVDLMQQATAQGLRVLTYGLENNSIDLVAKQQALGVHAAIVDDVERTLPGLMNSVQYDVAAA